MWEPCQRWIQFGPKSYVSTYMRWTLVYFEDNISTIYENKFLTSGNCKVRSINTPIRQKMCISKFSRSTKKMRNTSKTRALWMKDNTLLGLTQWGTYMQYQIIRNGDQRWALEFLKNYQYPEADHFLILQDWVLAVS